MKSKKPNYQEKSDQKTTSPTFKEQADSWAQALSDNLNKNVMAEQREMELKAEKERKSVILKVRKQFIKILGHFK